MPFNLQPQLEDEFIYLRPLREDDFVALFAVASDPYIWEQHPNSDRYQQTIFEQFFREAMLSKGALVVIDKESQQIIGSSRYNVIPNAPEAIEIGWTFLARAYWGGQYNRAMKHLMITHAATFVEYIVFYIGGDNIRSQKAVQKLGAKRVDPQEHPHLVKDARDNWIYVLQIQ